MDLRHLDIPRRARPRGAFRPGGARVPRLAADALVGDPAARERGRLPDRPALAALRGADARGRAGARVGAAHPRGRRRPRRRARRACAAGSRGQLRIGAIPTSLPSRLAPDDAALREPPRDHRRGALAQLAADRARPARVRARARRHVPRLRAAHGRAHARALRGALRAAHRRATGRSARGAR